MMAGMRRLRAIAAAALLGPAGCGGTTPGGPAPASAHPSPPSTLTVTADAFVDGGRIPIGYTCRGDGRVPVLSWSGDLRHATAVAVVVDDPDAPGRTFVHRIVVDLPPQTSSLGERPPAGAHEARNSAGRGGWTPPCPPSGTHHYRFTVYGLSSPTGLPDGAATADALAAIEARAVARGQLIGLYGA
jgi:hypothetical protein